MIDMCTGELAQMGSENIGANDTFGKQNLAQMIPLKNSNWRKRTAAICLVILEKVRKLGLITYSFDFKCAYFILQMKAFPSVIR